MTGAVVLWDIDGTLLRAAGTGTRSYTAALMTVAGVPFPTTTANGRPIDMGGRTDPDIAAIVLSAAGFDDPALVPLLLAEVEAVYASSADEFRALTEAKPGAHAALAALAEHSIAQTLVTGNLESVARHKVTAVGLETHLRFEHGGYGSDHAVRTELVRLSRQRLAAGGTVVRAERTWVIGDTPRDLQCAREAGVRCLLVATGTHSLESLAGLGADAVLPDLTDVDRLLELVAQR